MAQGDELAVGQEVQTGRRHRSSENEASEAIWFVEGGTERNASAEAVTDHHRVGRPKFVAECQQVRGPQSQPLGKSSSWPGWNSGLQAAFCRHKQFASPLDAAVCHRGTDVLALIGRLGLSVERSFEHCRKAGINPTK